MREPSKEPCLEETRTRQHQMNTWLTGAPEQWEEDWERLRETFLYTPLPEESEW